MEFKLNSEQFQAALRAVLAGVIVLIVAQTLRFEDVNWSLLTVLILIQPRARATYQKGIYRVIGTLGGAVIAVVLISLFAQEPLLLFLSLGACFFPIFYLMSGKLLPYSFLMMGFTLIMVASSGLQVPEKAVITAVFRTTEICLGVVTSIFITIWIWPQSAESSLLRTLKEISVSLRTALAGRFHPEMADGHSLEKIKEDVLAKLDQLPVLADQVILEGNLDPEEQQKLLRACHQWEALATGLFEWLDTPAELVLPRVQSGEREELEKFAAALDRVLEHLGDEPGGSADSLRGEMEAVMDGLLGQLVRQREEGWSGHFKPEENFAYYRILEAAKNILACLKNITLPPLRSNPSSHLAKDLPVWTRLPEQLWADLRAPEPARLNLAIKTTALFMLLLLASQAAHLDFMLQSMISALLVLSQSNVGSTVHKALLRLAGAIGGGLLALLVLTTFNPWLNSLAFLLILLSCVMFLSSYIANGPPSYSYIGIQLGLAFFLTMFGGFAPPVTLDPAIERFVGVLVGSLLAILLTTSVMPEHAGAELALHMRRLREQLGKAFHRIRQGQGEAGMELAGPELKQCQSELTQAANYLLHSRIEGMMEPESSRQNAVELDKLRQVYHLLKDLNEVPSVLHKLPRDHSLTQAVERAMDTVEGRLLDPSYAGHIESRHLSEALIRARKEGTLVKWDAADVTAAGAAMYLVGQLLNIQAPAAELGPGFQLESLG